MEIVGSGKRRGQSQAFRKKRNYSSLALGIRKGSRAGPTVPAPGVPNALERHLAAIFDRRPNTAAMLLKAFSRSIALFIRLASVPKWEKSQFPYFGAFKRLSISVGSATDDVLGRKMWLRDS